MTQSEYIKRCRQKASQDKKQSRQQLARAHRPMNQQVVEKILSRHGRQ